MNPRIINYIRWIVINGTERNVRPCARRVVRNGLPGSVVRVVGSHPIQTQTTDDPTNQPTSQPSSEREIPFVVCNCCAHRLPENVTGILIFNRHSAFVRRGDYDCPFVAVHVSLLLLLRLLLLLGSIYLSVPSSSASRLPSIHVAEGLTGNEMERNY